MTATATAPHTVGIETVTAETRPYMPANATHAVVERFEGRLVKVVISDADQLHGTLQAYAKSAAHIYGATLNDTTHELCDTVADVLRRSAAHTAAPVNASLSEALHAAARGNRTLATEAARLLARILRRHVRDLGWWDRTHTRTYVATTLAVAATAVTR